MRYRQVKTENGYEMVPVNDKAPARVEISGASAFEAFKSVVDGSIVTSRRELAEHNRRNNCVHESEFGSRTDHARFLAGKAAERADVFQGTTNTLYGKQIQRQRKNDIAEVMRRYE